MKHPNQEKDKIEISVIYFRAFFQVNEINERSECEDN